MAESEVLTVDEYLDGIRKRRDHLEEEKRVQEEYRDQAIERLGAIVAEMCRIDEILGKGATQANGRGKRVQSFVFEQMKKLYDGSCSVPENRVVSECRRERPELTEASVQSALRRLAKKGLITRSGPRYNRQAALVGTVPSEAASEPSVRDRILNALGKAYPEALPKEKLIWEGGDLVEVEAELGKLVDAHRIAYQVEDSGEKRYRYKEPENAPTQGKMLFGGAENPEK